MASVVSAMASAGMAMERTPLKMNGIRAMVEKRIICDLMRRWNVKTNSCDRTARIGSRRVVGSKTKEWRKRQAGR